MWQNLLSTAAIIVLTTAASALVFMIALGLAQSALAGLLSVMALYLAEAVLVALPAFRLGVLIYPQDVVFVLLLLAAILRLYRGPAPPQLIWLLFGGLILLGGVRGVLAYGIRPMGVEMRPFFYFFAGTLYVATFWRGADLPRRVQAVVESFALMLVALAVFRWVATGLGMGIVQHWAPITTHPMRVLHAGHAFFLAQAAIMTLSTQLSKGRKASTLSGVLLGAVILLQHRTVWAVMIAAGSLALIFGNRVRSRLIIAFSRTSLVGALVILLLFGARLDELSSSLAASSSSALADQSTFLWRVEGWGMLLTQFMNSGALNMLLGQPFGAGYSRVIGEVVVNVSPHNFYVQTLLRTGVVGLALFLFVYATLAAASFRSRTSPGHGVTTGCLLLLLVSQSLFFITYAPGFEQTIFLGLTFAAVAQRAYEARLQRGSAFERYSRGWRLQTSLAVRAP